jgi:DNA-binding response OmpR family regulator
MPYIFKQKLDIRELVDLPVKPRKILIAEPEEFLLALYAYHLSNSDYFVKPCRELLALEEAAESFVPHLLVINASLLGSKGAPGHFLGRLRRLNPSMQVVTVGQNTEPQELKFLMAAGSNAHIDRRHTRPEDITAIVKALLR